MPKTGPEPYALSGHRLATPKGAEMGEDGETKISGRSGSRM